jgi:16S rRNA (guanine966-N2)-methyltransferase
LIRITGGELRGRSLRVAAGTRTRPSAARLREALFSMLGPRVKDARVADLFAGSGVLGLEALSRGAAHVVFVEIDPRAVRMLHENLQRLGLDEARARVHRGDARRFLRRWADPGSRTGSAEAVRLVLMDPPYRPGELRRLLLPAARLVESGSIELCVLEHASTEPPLSSLDAPAVRWTTRKHGRGAFTLIERNPRP